MGLGFAEPKLQYPGKGVVMGKEQNTRKTTKKKPAKTLKEKRKDKKAKKVKGPLTS
jgi:hypothetical protein